MHSADEEKTAFITENANFCYKVMPFRLKNAGATYQRLMDKVFQRQIGRNIEIYVDDMVVKSNSLVDHIADLAEIFGELRKHNMRLNPEKCTFGVKGGKFLGFMLSARGIEANRDKCQVVLDMRKAFVDLKTTLATPPNLTRSEPSSPLLVYLAISEEAISSVLVQEKEGTQTPIYFVSRFLQDSETRYQLIEKVRFGGWRHGLGHTSRRLRHYFQSHRVVVRTDCPISKVLGKPELAGKMMSWSVELSQFDIVFKLRGPIKAQCLADFMNELHLQGHFEEQWWTLHVDSSSNCQGSGAGVILEGPKGITLEQSLRFRFKASNNQAEYEALLAGLRLAEDMGASRIKCLTDSKVVAEQVEVLVEHIPREDNTRADQLARLAATKRPGQLRTIIQQEIDHPSVEAQSQRLPRLAGRNQSIHEGICGMHSRARTTVSKLLRAASPSMVVRHMGANILGPFPITKEQCNFLIVVVDLFTKWIEAEPLASISVHQVQKFLWKNFITRFGVPSTLLTDNGLQFTDQKLNEFLAGLAIQHKATSVEHPQMNGQAELANKVILTELKKRLG
uniref:Retrovirus-related Pol polyprotein from transposon 17.6 n=1 Tax=Cajanus cajan TaxID=3821 RepID=A0A151RND2_CAJCA|nr:Retrovirus-related Pol polyprotein from transposon 17.6 [Cajanus cajan]